MERELKPGMRVCQKTKFNGKTLAILLPIIALAASQLACSRGYYSASELTATAVTSILHGDATLPPPPFIPSPTPEVSTYSSGIGGGLPFIENENPDEDPEPTIVAYTPTSTPEPPSGTITPAPPILYYSQSGDTLPAVAYRFGVANDEITSTQLIPATGLIQPGTLLVIPSVLGTTGPTEIAMPDSEVVYSPSALDFDIESFIDEANGYLSQYREYLSSGWYNGAQVIKLVSIENSINPRLLLAILEYESHWVYGTPDTLSKIDYPMGYVDFNKKGLYQQLSWAVSQLSVGYYGWRAGLIHELEFEDGKTIRMAPGLNAGTAAVQNLFSKLFDSPDRWAGALYGAESLPLLYKQMFGDPWARAQTIEPLYPPNLVQPEIELPFIDGHTWSFSGGPHSAWGPNGALAALDFAPMSMESGCVESKEWVAASAAGLVVRSENGTVIVDMDGDGREQTGWAMLYLHIATKDRVAAGTWVATGEKLGHPSCEGGVVTGTHVHIARKYNGEWILADGPLPFVLSGWTAHAGEKDYEGELTRDGESILALPNGSHQTLITRISRMP